MAPRSLDGYVGGRSTDGYARAVFEVRDAATFRKRQRAGVLHNASRIGGRVQHFHRGDCPSQPWFRGVLLLEEFRMDGLDPFASLATIAW